MTKSIRQIILSQHSTNGKIDGYTMTIRLHSGQEYPIFVSEEEMETPVDHENVLAKLR